MCSREDILLAHPEVSIAPQKINLWFKHMMIFTGFVHEENQITD